MESGVMGTFEVAFVLTLGCEGVPPCRSIMSNESSTVTDSVG